MKRLLIIIMAIICSGALQVTAQLPVTELIRLNQVGFYPDGPKVAVVNSNEAASFSVMTSDQKKTVYKGQLEEGIKSLYSDKIYKAADFTQFKKPGKYVLVIPGIGSSYPFEIRDDVHSQVAQAAIKNYYFQRMSIELKEEFAGKWHREAGHPDTQVLIHASAASSGRPEGTQISCPRGWYDAGDYNKYVVNSGITMGTMFSAYEDFEEFYKGLALNIPESNNGVPDLLDELIWNLRWMLTMQDPVDGGVYHKLTNPKFDPFIMPAEAKGPRYVVQKGTGAALNFAAVTAQASRIFHQFNAQLPGLSDSCLSASRRAWEWAKKNPAVEYNQSELNKQFDPDITTGAYGDKKFDDEFFWAGVELFLTTGDEAFLDNSALVLEEPLALPGWNQVRMLGLYSLVRFEKKLPTGEAVRVKEKLLQFNDKLIEGASSHALKTVMGKSKTDYIWGSSSVAANQGISLIQAYKISGKKIYLEHAIANLDYLLGRNGTGYCFVTGFGSRQVMHPHHRPSEADKVVEPIPGMLSGGPNPSMQDKCKYASSVPEEAFVDDVCSCASNEVAINWNAPLVYLAGALEALAKGKH